MSERCSSRSAAGSTATALLQLAQHNHTPHQLSLAQAFPAGVAGGTQEIDIADAWHLRS